MNTITPITQFNKISNQNKNYAQPLEKVCFHGKNLRMVNTIPMTISAISSFALIPPPGNL